MKLSKTGLRLKGHSRSTEMTCFYIPELCIYFDAGVHGYYSCDHIFITHGHGDHIQALNGILKSQNQERSKKPMPIYCPNDITKMLSKYVEAYFQVNANNPYLKCHKIIAMKGVNIGDRIPLKIKNHNYIIDAFECAHSVPTLGYGISESREKLLDELKGKPQTDIVALKKTGVAITKTIEVPLVCYLGDTTHEVFEIKSNGKIFNYPNIIVECSFLEKDELIEAQKCKHMHWDNLKPIIERHPDCHFILIHFSLRYMDSDIEKFFNGKLMKNMTVWTDNKLLEIAEITTKVVDKQDTKVVDKQDTKGETDK